MKKTISIVVLGGLFGLSLLSQMACTTCGDGQECRSTPLTFGGGDGHIIGADDAQEGSVQQDAALNADEKMDALVSALCQVAHECDAHLAVKQCVVKMNGEEGKDIWGVFGLGEGNRLSTAEIKKNITQGLIDFDQPSYIQCLRTIDDEMECSEDGKPVFQVDEGQDFPCATILEEVVS